MGGRITVGPVEFFSLTGGMKRGTAHGLAVATGSHTVVQTTDDHARYRTWLNVTLEVRSTTHRIEPVTRIVPAELGVPSHEAADFERRVLGRDAPLLRQASLEPGSPVEARPFVRSLLAEAAELGVGLPDSAYRRPERLDAQQPTPHELEPLALATRKGVGFGSLMGLPGAELVHDQIRTVIGLTHRQLTGRRLRPTPRPPFLKLRRPRVNWAGADKELLTSFGRPSLETDLAQLMSGVEHSVLLGGRTYDVSVTARLLDRVGGVTGDEARPLSLNVRSGQGATITGERRNSQGLRAFLGARGGVELAEFLKLQLGQAGVTGETGGGTQHRFSGAAKSTQRADMGGKADEHVYDVVYELSVRTDGHPEQKWWIDRPDEVVARVAVPHPHVPAVRIPEEVLREAYRTQPLESLPDEDRRVDFAGRGTAAVYRSVVAPPEVVRAAADLYQRANGRPGPTPADPANWPAEIKRLFSPNELVAHFPALAGDEGRLIELPDGPDGWHQALRLRIVAVDAYHVQAHSGVGFQLWQNTSGTAHYARTAERNRSFGVAGRIGPVFHLGGTEAQDEESPAAEEKASTADGQRASGEAPTHRASSSAARSAVGSNGGRRPVTAPPSGRSASPAAHTAAPSTAIAPTPCSRSPSTGGGSPT